MQEQLFKKLLDRYELAFFELNDYETQVLPIFKNGKVIHGKLVISLEQFESTVLVMEAFVRESESEAGSDFVQVEEGRGFFNWLILSRIVEVIRSVLESKK